MASIKSTIKFPTLKEILKEVAKSEKLISEENAREILVESIKNTTQGMKPEDIVQELDNIIKKMEIWLKDFNNKKNLFEKQGELNTLYYLRQEKINKKDLNRSKLAQYYQANSDLKRAVAYQNYNKQLQESFITGYILWESFRGYATNQHINFSIAYSENKYSKSNKKIYEAKEISLLELLDRTKDRLKLVRNYNKEQTSFTYNIKINSIERREEDEEIGVFYEQLKQHFIQYTQNHNRGAIYETYGEIEKTWHETFHSYLKKGVTEDWFKYPERFEFLKNMVIANDIDWSGGRQIGDQELTQYKNAEHSAANFSGIQSLSTDIDALIKAWHGDKAEIKNKLKQILTVDATSNSIHISDATRTLNEAAQNYIDNLKI